MATVIDIDSRAALRTARMLAERHQFAVFPLYEPITAPDGTHVCSCQAGPSCRNPGKHPRTPNGCKAATTDLAQITQWWTRWPTANIAIATGDASHIVVLDIDPRNEGDATFGALVHKHGDLPETPSVRTGGDGFHLFFKRPFGVPYVCGRPLGAGVDVKADGGYVVAIGSLHVSGKRYEIQTPFDTPLAELPDWVATQLIRDRPRPAGAPQPVLAGFLGRAAHLAGWLGRYISPNKASVRCPWEDSHTSGERGDSSTVVFGPSEGRKAGWWHCSHAHCAGRTQHEFADMLPDPAKRQARIELGLAETYLPPLATDSLPPPDGDEDTSWHRSLHLNAQNHPTKIPGNAAVLLANLPEWKYCLAIDEFADRVFWEAPPPAVPGLVAPAVDTNVSDDHVTYVQQWFAIHRNVSFSTEAVREAINQAAQANRRNPPRDYLLGLEWDRLPRLSTWLADYLGADDNEYTRAVGRMWAISAVARILEPGAQADHMLVLEGGQGSGKSTAVRILAGKWFLGTLPDLRSKDAPLALAGSWIVEIGELDAFRGAAGTRVKDFVTQQVDSYRPPYGRFSVHRPRTCVFVGTTNDDHWAKDPTGGRRFWPVHVVALDRYALQRDRDQLWAEAVAAYNSSEEWYPQGEIVHDIAAEQEDRFEVDEWEPLIARWLTPHQSHGATIGEIMLGALKIEAERWTKADQFRIAAILRRLGWNKPKTDKRRANSRERVWYPTHTQAPAEVGEENF